jgi:hypothetical protein
MLSFARLLVVGILWNHNYVIFHISWHSVPQQERERKNRVIIFSISDKRQTA